MTTKELLKSSLTTDCLPNELHVVIFEFFLSTSDDWRSDWIKISLVSKKWNSLSFIAFYKTFPNHAIMWASEYGHFDVVDMLLKNTETDPSTEDNYAFYCAQKKGYKNMVQLLLNDKRFNSFQLANYKHIEFNVCEKVHYHF